MFATLGHTCIISENMPRKTRRQKEKTRTRRTQSSAANGAEGTHPELVKREFTFSLASLKKNNFEAKTPKRHEKSVTFDTSSFGRGDLVKSLVLAVGIFTLEVVIYLLLTERR